MEKGRLEVYALTVMGMNRFSIVRSTEKLGAVDFSTSELTLISEDRVGL